MRWGYGGGLRWLLLNRPVRRPALGSRHAGDDFRELLEAMGSITVDEVMESFEEMDPRPTS
ncbi:MAG: hypothetical protein GY856_17545 [bacterium]|nr:hypothetical protein [bacterium]